MIQHINYRIGEFYKYPNYDVLYKLIEKRSYVFIFECGHRCTDSVFVDLIRVKTGIQVYKDLQLEIEF